MDCIQFDYQKDCRAYTLATAAAAMYAEHTAAVAAAAAYLVCGMREHAYKHTHTHHTRQLIYGLL